MNNTHLDNKHTIPFLHVIYTLLIFSICLIPDISYASTETLLNTKAYSVSFPEEWIITDSQISEDNEKYTIISKDKSSVAYVMSFRVNTDNDETKIEGYYKSVIHGLHNSESIDTSEGIREDLLIDSHQGFFFTYEYPDMFEYDGCVIINNRLILIQFYTKYIENKELAINIINSITYKKVTAENTHIEINNSQPIVLSPSSKYSIPVQIETPGVLDYSIVYSIDNKKISSGTWGDWTNNTVNLILEGKSTGSTMLKIYLKDNEDVCNYSVISSVPFDLTDNSKYSDTEFLFRNIPWGSSYAEINKTLGLKKHTWASLDDNAQLSVLDKALNLSDGDSYKDEVGKYYWNVNPDSITVAGHKLSSIWLYCAYTVDEHNKVLKDDEHTKLYYAYYSFEIRDLEKDYADLKEKLIGLYGNPLQSDYINSRYYDNCFCDIWFGKNSTIMCLNKCFTVLGDPRLILSYGTLDGNDWLLDVYKSIISEEEEQIKTSVDGL